VVVLRGLVASNGSGVVSRPVLLGYRTELSNDWMLKQLVSQRPGPDPKLCVASAVEVSGSPCPLVDPRQLSSCGSPAGWREIKPQL